jgi:hypothetical protein
MQFKALAIDLDGTLLVGEKIPPDNIVAVRAALPAAFAAPASGGNVGDTPEEA